MSSSYGDGISGTCILGRIDVVKRIGLDAVELCAFWIAWVSEAWDSLLGTGTRLDGLAKWNNWTGTSDGYR